MGGAPSARPACGTTRPGSWRRPAATRTTAAQHPPPPPPLPPCCSPPAEWLGSSGPPSASQTRILFRTSAHHMPCHANARQFVTDEANMTAMEATCAARATSLPHSSRMHCHAGLQRPLDAHAWRRALFHSVHHILAPADSRTVLASECAAQHSAALAPHLHGRDLQGCKDFALDKLTIVARCGRYSPWCSRDSAPVPCSRYCASVTCLLPGQAPAASISVHGANIPTAGGHPAVQAGPQPCQQPGDLQRRPGAGQRSRRRRCRALRQILLRRVRTHPPPSPPSARPSRST